MLTKSVIKLQAYFLAFVSLVMIVSINCLARNAEYPTENTVSASVIQQDDSEYEAYVESCSIESNAKEDIRPLRGIHLQVQFAFVFPYITPHCTISSPRSRIT